MFRSALAKGGLPVPPQQQPEPGRARQIPEDHVFDPDALSPLARTLYAVSYALSHTVAAYRQMSHLKSSTVSPDGLLGGRGYVMSVKDIRARLLAASEALSDIADTIHDEVTAPHWAAGMGELSQNAFEDVHALIAEATKLQEDPEEAAEEDIEEVESQNDEPDPEPEEEEEGTVKTAVSSVDPNTLSGPRVEHIDRSSTPSPNGSWNPHRDQELDILQEGLPREPDYEGSADLLVYASRYARSNLPFDTRPTDAWDWGIGYGAHGEGVGAEPLNSDRQSPVGPRSEDPVGVTDPRDRSILPGDILRDLPRELRASAEVPTVPNAEVGLKSDISRQSEVISDPTQSYISYDYFGQQRRAEDVEGLTGLDGVEFFGDPVPVQIFEDGVRENGDGY